MTEFRVVPIHTVEDLDAALAAGVEGEFSAYPDPYDLPRTIPGVAVSTDRRFSGWVPSVMEHWRYILAGGPYAAQFAAGNWRLRAFYPDD